MSNILIITSGSATFPSVNALWVGLINAGLKSDSFEATPSQWQIRCTFLYY